MNWGLYKDVVHNFLSESPLHSAWIAKSKPAGFGNPAGANRDLLKLIYLRTRNRVSQGETLAMFLPRLQSQDQHPE